jgi:N-acetylmuramic acid 6-phosphate etherase
VTTEAFRFDGEYGASGTGVPDLRASEGGAVRPWTETANPVSRGLDTKSTREILDLMHSEDLRAYAAVGAALAGIAALAEVTIAALRSGGRLIYVGAGTSGRLGVLDASECPPTFGVSRELVQAIIAGGDVALRLAVEGAEDSGHDGRAAVSERCVQSADVVCGIAASGTTPFVCAALSESAARGATTALIHSNPGFVEPEPGVPRHAILLDVGPEVLAGSTRLKCGTATKMALNLLTTTVMVRLGKVYDNLMVDVVPTNAKLHRRACQLIGEIGEVGERRAEALLAASGQHVKTAIVMARAGLDAIEARRALDASDGNLRRALVALGVAHDAS